jgi:ThiF family protein
MKTHTVHPDTALRCHLPEHSRIKIIGLGGIGCVVLQFMAVFLKSLGRPTRLVLIDGDRFEPANSQRMVFQTVGNKAEVKADETVEMLGQCDVSVIAVPEYITVENAERLIVAGDYVLLCVDNHPTRKLVADRVAQLDDVVLVSGGNEGIEPPRERGTYGNVQVHVRKGGKDVTVPITKYHPEIANPKGKLPTDADCGQMALSTPQILFTNLAVASAMLNAFFAFTCSQLGYQEAKLDILDARMLPQFLLKEKV